MRAIPTTAYCATATASSGPIGPCAVTRSSMQVKKPYEERTALGRSYSWRWAVLRGELRLVRLLGAPREVCARLEGGAPPRRLHRSPGSLREDGGDGVDVFECRARRV